MAQIKILCFTWNVGNEKPVASEHAAWLPAQGRGFDLVVVGTQENSGWDRSRSMQVAQVRTARVSLDEQSLTPLKASTRATDGITLVAVEAHASSPIAPDRINVSLGKWEQIVLERLGAKWVVVQHVGLMAMRLTVFARKEAMHGLITNVQSARSATGVGGAVGNKGGLVVGLCYGPISLGFVSCHLAAHMGKLVERNNDFYEVLRETRGKVGASELVDASFAFEHVVCMGDLNYRVQFPEDHSDGESVSSAGVEDARDTAASTQRALALIKAKRYDELVEHDQLRTCQAEGTAFVGFREGNLIFAPTFKVERAVGVHYKDKRVPSYCDRILWKSQPTSEGAITQTHLSSVPSVTTSDHKPVVAHFVIHPPPRAIERAYHADRQSFPLVRLSNVRVFLKGAQIDFLSSTCDPYAVFHTQPVGLLGDDEPVTAVTKSDRRVTGRVLAGLASDERARRHLSRELTTAKLADGDMHGYTWAWTDKQLPLLRPMVTGGEADLQHVTLIVTMFDRDVVNQDDSLGSVAIPLGRPTVHRGNASEYHYAMGVEVPWEHGVGYFMCNVSVSLGLAVPIALTQANKERAGSQATTLSRHNRLRRGLACASAGGGRCAVQ